MEMKKISLQRMQWVFSKYMTENWKKDIRDFLILFFLCMIFSGNSIRTGLPYFFLYLMVLVNSANVFSVFGNRNKGTDYLMIPASTFEKLTVNLFIIHIFKTIGYFIMLVLGVKIGSWIYSMFVFTQITPAHFSEIVSVVTISTVLALISFQAAFIFGSLYFKKAAFLKSLLVSFIALTGMGLITALLIVNFLNINDPYYTAGFKLNIEPEMLNTGALILSAVTSLIPVVYFWVMSYLRLREMEA